MADIQEIIVKLRKFRDDRDWAQFHNSKDLALALSIEAAELNELFLWKSAEEVDIEKLRSELADVFSYCLLLLDKHGLDLGEIIDAKLHLNNEKYPADQVRGSAKKYTEL
ncbi:nucleotide pyrophosphohydrolase [Turneriella parva]|uniref:MazG nucleotide pyrophosphohydrolase n=1 Tax=Turneriella parva (strain ATCC BAA-1111 / DSM 21527 / NCTC 11395 / H) TaxID=869212 RepID=I4B2J7_TURPD|nr:nucleotide pyrophosphohydrolase [Turneriella parva]AFM11504.1 MazG nucleotide pyrophosphohydrolase [Turneriella parva DSM 21527]